MQMRRTASLWGPEACPPAPPPPPTRPAPLHRHSPCWFWDIPHNRGTGVRLGGDHRKSWRVDQSCEETALSLETKTLAGTKANGGPLGPSQQTGRCREVKASY